MSIVNYKRRAEAVHFEEEEFVGLDLRSMNAFGSTWTKCKFVDCQFDVADWRGSKFDGCHFEDCRMLLTDFGTSFFENTIFQGCNMEKASFMGSHFREVGFGACRMAYGDFLFQNATVKQRMWLNDCDLHGSNLDFREVEPGALSFNHCDLWGAKVPMGCAIWSASFDERTVRQFLALLARVSDDPRIAELAGDQYAVVQRAMDGATKCTPVSTTSQATTSTPTLNSQAQTATTASAASPEMIAAMMSKF